MKRDFKGVWIPAEVWLNSELNVMEKLFLVEIDSLDNEDGCYASNKHFADFFGLSKSRCSEVITKLTNKGLITSQILMDGNVVSMRILRVVEKLNGGIRETEGGIRKTRRGYSENANTSNTVNNTIKTNSAFDSFWSNYPCKQNKQAALKAFARLSVANQKKAHSLLNDFIDGLPDFQRKDFKLHASTYLNNKRWEDEIADSGNDYLSGVTL